MVRELVVIGCSTGGARTLPRLLAALPSDFPAAIVAAQHRGPDGEAGDLAGFLRARSALAVAEAEDAAPIEPGVVHLAPADYHLLVEGTSFALSTEAPRLHARPSIDVLFDSAAEAFGEKLVGVILTGTGADGAVGLRRIATRGGFTIVQDPGTCERREMPEAAIAAGAPDRIVVVEEIPGLLVGLCTAGSKAA